jgi:hypothetical protein
VRGRPEESGTNDPQPEVDRKISDKMYRELDLQA